jgi:circadian clock protein KaiC
MTLNRISTGITGLDEILCGGLISNQAYLIRGQPGSGKTILGFHFLNAGILEGETVLFITFGESEPRLRRNAKIIGIDLEKVNFLDLSPTADFFTGDQSYDIFSPADVEREPLTKSIIEKIELIKPQRIFLDAITQFRYLAQDQFQFRQQVLSFLQFILEREITLLLTSEISDRHSDDDLQFMSDAVIQLYSTAKGRSLVVNKFRVLVF